MPPKIIAVVGPTASGKTALSIRLASMLNGEIVSCDSMQIYRRMQIGTAAPTKEEMAGIPHHLIGFLDPADSFSCADYTDKAEASIRGILEKNKMPVLCGGTGLYLDSLLRISSFSDAAASPEVREKWNTYAETFGHDALHAKLREMDPLSADAIHRTMSAG